MASPNNDAIPPSPSGSNANGENDQNVEKGNFQNVMNNTTNDLKPENLGVNKKKNLSVNEKMKIFEREIESQNSNPVILQRGGILPRNPSFRKSFVPIPVKNEDLENLRCENNINKDKIKELEAEKHTREEKLKELEEEIEELKVKIYDLENLRNENDINKVKMEELEAEKHTSEEKLKDLEEQNILLKGKIDEFTERLAKVDEIELRTNDLVIGVDHTQTINQRRENTNCDEDDSDACKIKGNVADSGEVEKLKKEIEKMKIESKKNVELINQMDNALSTMRTKLKACIDTHQNR